MLISTKEKLISYKDNDLVRSEVLENFSRIWALEQEEGRFIRAQSDKEPFHLAGRKVENVGAGGNPDVKNLDERAQNEMRKKLPILLNITGSGTYYTGHILKT